MATKSIKVKLEATLPVPETQPAKSPCSAGCGGKCGKGEATKPLLQHAADILFNMLGDKYPPEQINGALEVLDALLRKHYSHQ